ncbi:MAG: GIY-YIG nuclease family protein [Patescibacteria group bacterium]
MANKDGEGIVYILTNEAMPGYVKIGKTTTSVEQRVLELSRSTAVPVPFECFYAARVADMSTVERAFHDAFDDFRKNPRREFFSIAPERVVAVLRLLALEEVTPSRDSGVESREDAVALEEARERRSAFNFKMVDISPGAILTFTRDESITCRVAEDFKHVEFRDKVLSLSKAAQEALGSAWPVQGPAYWKYHGEILDDRRIRLEEGDVLDSPKIR